jgi:hypothetical protein
VRGLRLHTPESDGAVRLSTDAGLLVVTDRCMGVTHAQFGLEPRTAAAAEGGMP